MYKRVRKKNIRRRIYGDRIFANFSNLKDHFNEICFETSEMQQEIVFHWPLLQFSLKKHHFRGQIGSAEHFSPCHVAYGAEQSIYAM